MVLPITQDVIVSLAYLPVVRADFARQLERELAAAIKERDGLHTLHNRNAAYMEELRQLCAALRSQLRTAEEAKGELAKAISAMEKASFALTWSQPVGGHSCSGIVTKEEVQRAREDADDEMTTAIIAARKLLAATPSPAKPLSVGEKQSSLGNSHDSSGAASDAGAKATERERIAQAVLKYIDGAELDEVMNRHAVEGLKNDIEFIITKETK